MPNISVSVPQTDSVLSYELAEDFTIADLKGLISADTGLTVESQVLIFNGTPLGNNAQTLQAAGINDNDMIVCGANPTSPQQQSRTPAIPAPQSAEFESQLEALRQRLVAQSQHPQAREQLKAEAPALEAALNDPPRFRTAYLELQRQRQAEAEALNNDFSEAGQAKIYEAIRRENVDNEHQKTMRENPELFGRVTMLYVNLTVNGYPVKAFVDSGAQATIMSPACAEACHITHLIDNRFAGIAKGVGTAKILGRVHRAKVRIGDADDLACSFTVMEGKDIDMLLGLDMLKRYQACIDLQNNQLVLAGGSVRVPFLPENEIPQNFNDAMENEPTIAGPDGTEIGTTSGAVKPAGSSASASASSSAFAGPGRSLASASSTSTSTTKPPTQPQPSPSSASTSTAATAPPPRPPAPTPAQSEFPQESIDVLQGIGFTREQAIQALRACNGSVDYAAGLLFDQ